MVLKSALIALAGFVSLAAAPVQQARDLAWLSGTWISEDKDGWTEEIWSGPRGGNLIGLNRSGKGDKATGFEFMRIAPNTDGVITFWASPGGKAPVPFKMVSSGPAEVAFENPANDYPLRVVYRRKGNLLTGTIYGPGGKNPMRWTFKRQGGR